MPKPRINQSSMFHHGSYKILESIEMESVKAGFYLTCADASRIGYSHHFGAPHIWPQDNLLDLPGGSGQAGPGRWWEAPGPWAESYGWFGSSQAVMTSLHCWQWMSAEIFRMHKSVQISQVYPLLFNFQFSIPRQLQLVFFCFLKLCFRTMKALWNYWSWKH